MPRNPEYDMTFNCLGIGPDGNYGQGVIKFGFDISGEKIGIGVFAEPIEFGLDIEASLNIGLVWPGIIDFSPTLLLSGDYYSLPSQNNWVRWSDIGNLDFTINRKNLAGEAPMGWAGSVFKIIKLNSSVIIYGSGGITQMLPHNSAWGIKTIHKIGVKGRGAVVGTDSIHFFIDMGGKLWMLTDVIEEIGYEEFLSPMSNPIMSYDRIADIIYICDGTSGYAYSVLDKSLGAGPVNITGVGYLNGVSYAVASGGITYPLFELSSDILDMQTRKHKTIRTIEVGVDAEALLKASVDFSIDHRAGFISSGWTLISPEGMAFPTCFGKEFKIRIASAVDQEISLDYIKIKGIIHDFNPLDG